MKTKTASLNFELLLSKPKAVFIAIDRLLRGVHLDLSQDKDKGRIIQNLNTLGREAKSFLNEVKRDPDTAAQYEPAKLLDFMNDLVDAVKLAITGVRGQRSVYYLNFMEWLEAASNMVGAGRPYTMNIGSIKKISRRIVMNSRLVPELLKLAESLEKIACGGTCAGSCGGECSGDCENCQCKQGNKTAAAKMFDPSVPPYNLNLIMRRNKIQSVDDITVGMKAMKSEDLGEPEYEATETTTYKVTKDFMQGGFRHLVLEIYTESSLPYSDREVRAEYYYPVSTNASRSKRSSEVGKDYNESYHKNLLALLTNAQENINKALVIAKAGKYGIQPESKRTTIHDALSKIEDVVSTCLSIAKDSKRSKFASHPKFVYSTSFNDPIPRIEVLLAAIGKSASEIIRMPDGAIVNSLNQVAFEKNTKLLKSSVESAKKLLS